jgi:hypothetical protein
MTLIVHVGSPKTGSSTLQNAFFPAHPGLLFLGKYVDRGRAYEGWRDTAFEKLARAMEASEANYKPDLSAVSSLIEGLETEAAGRPIVLSDEGLCMFTGADCMAKLGRVAEIFAALAPFRFILCVREQLSLIKSNYITEHRAEMLRLPGKKQSWYPNFDQFVDIHFRYACGSVLDSYRYAFLIEQLESLVGAKNVLVYGFEDFKADPIATLRRICRFMEVDEFDPCLERTATTRENEHHSARVYAINMLRRRVLGDRTLGGVVPKWLKTGLNRWAASGRRFDFTASADTARRVQDYYRADNEMLFLKCGIRL